jgi:hypothetical protein
MFLLLLTTSFSMNSQNCNATFIAANTFTNQTITAATVRGALPPAAVTNIRITGTVNFNANVSFTNCLIRLDPGAIINVNNNATFTLLAASNIFACATQWQAINVNAGGAIVFRNSFIQGGRQGIVLNTGFNNASCVLTDNTFSLAGVVLKSMNIKMSLLEKISTEKLNSGIYFVRMKEKGKHVIIQRIVVAH